MQLMVKFFVKHNISSELIVSTYPVMDDFIPVVFQVIVKESDLEESPVNPITGFGTAHISNNEIITVFKHSKLSNT